jgi:polysaccharide biosynthesis/export protein ExoF
LGPEVKSLFKIAACMAVAAAAFPIGFGVADEREAIARSGPPDSAFCSQDDAHAGRFRSGDRITLTEYERIDPDQNERLPAAKTPFPSYRLRAEVSGDFDIAEDGTISVPILGQFQAAGKSVQELTDAIGHAFGSTLGHVGIITIAIAEHQPIYVDGVVKNPGAYKYTPGLTALHAVSLAGGYQDIKLESHSILLQTMQEADTGEQAKETLERLLARDAVLRAELASSPVATPQALLDLAGETRARALIAAQLSERKTVIETNAAQEEQQAQLIESAKQALELRTSQIQMVNSAIDDRDARMKTLRAMMSKGLIGEPVYQEAQAQYLDTLSRKQDVAVGIEQSQQQVSNAQSILTKLKLDARFALQHEISELELQIASQSIVYRSHMVTVGIINADPNATPGASPLNYDVVRREGGRAVTYRVKPSCLLQPGDLVRVYLGNGNPLHDAVSQNAAGELNAKSP